MKTFKKFLALALALALCALCALPALATEENDPNKVPKPGDVVKPDATYNLTLSNPATGHTYEVYQLLTGVPSFEEGEDKGWTLSNPAYGAATGWDNGGKTVAETMEQLSGMNSNSAAIDAFVRGLPFGTMTAFDSTIAESDAPLTWKVPGGYYIIRDVTNEDSEDEALSAIMVTVVGAVTVNTKTTTTTSDKKVDASTGEGANPDWQDAAQKEVGKEFKFKLTATVSTTDLDKYTRVYTNEDGTKKGGYYTLVFNDTMSAGLDFVRFDSFKVKDTDVANVDLSDLTASVTGKSFKVTIANLFDTIGKEKEKWEQYKTDGNIVVELIYTAKLNSNAIVYPAVGADKKPNWNNFNVSFSRDPSFSDENELGETTEDEVYVYTFKIDATKVAGDNDNTPLAGAGFKLYKVDGDKVKNDGEVAEGATAMRFKLGTEDPNKGKYVVSDAEDAKEEIFSAEEVGTFNFAGLEAGTYVLVETTTPAGYNTMANMVITITAKVDKNDPKVITMEQEAQQNGNEVEGTEVEGQPHFNVVNNKGSLLPSTGGIGTTIFYVVGGALVVGAGVLLFTKKRIGSKG